MEITNKPVIILVAPQMGENIGAVARAMGNFGLDDLRLVSPRDGWPNPAATAMAAHARAVIEAARCYDNLAEAIADCHFVAAATARSRDLAKPHCLSPQLFSPPPGGKLALLFGRENNGLSNEEIALAHQIVSIPVDAACPSINLAQSAAILCYEWYRAQQHAPPSLPPEAAPHAQLQGLFDQLEAALDEADFWKIADKKPKMWQNLRTPFLRAQLSVQEINSLRGVVRALQKHKK